MSSPPPPPLRHACSSATPAALGTPHALAVVRCGRHPRPYARAPCSDGTQSRRRRRDRPGHRRLRAHERWKVHLLPPPPQLSAPQGNRRGEEEKMLLVLWRGFCSLLLFVDKLSTSSKSFSDDFFSSFSRNMFLISDSSSFWFTWITATAIFSAMKSQ